MAKARYRRWRDDVFTHEKTGGMRFGAYGLMQYACAQNLLGVLRASPRALAGQFQAKPRDMQSLIDELVERGIAKWWPDRETLWIVEALDEQSSGATADLAAAHMLHRFEPEVRAAIVERYGSRVSANPDHESTHWVYFARDGEAVKIGCSSNPWARVAALRVGKPTTILLAKERGGFVLERELHARFAALLIKGEWYRFEGALRAYVEELPLDDGSSTTPTTGSDDGSPSQEAGSRKQEAPNRKQEKSIALLPQSSPPESAPPTSEGTAIVAVLTHPSGQEDSPAGRTAAVRRRHAAELWVWHEGERTRRLCATKTAPRGHEPADIARIVRLLEHVKRRHGCDDAEGWARLRSFRERALEQAEVALRTGDAWAPKFCEWARTDSAWSAKAYDKLAERAPEPGTSQAEARRADFQRRVELERRRQRAEGET